MQTISGVQETYLLQWGSPYILPKLLAVHAEIRDLQSCHAYIDERLNHQSVYKDMQELQYKSHSAMQELLPVLWWCHKMLATTRHDKQEETAICTVAAVDWGPKTLQNEAVIER